MLHLPVPNLDTYAWQAEGSCRGMDTELFYAAPGERGPRRTRREEAAKEVCAGCPVKTLCLEHALTFESFGVWGGTTEAERAEIRPARRSA